MALDISEQIQAGLQHHQAGRFQEAEAIYQSILSEQPHNPDILYLMGVLALQKGSNESAVDLVEKAIKYDPNQPNFYNISGEAHLALSHFETAISRYEQAIALQPDFAGAHNNLGNAYKQLNRLDDAIQHYEQAIALDPNIVMSYNNLGIALKELGRYEEALGHLKKAVTIMPNYGEAHSNLGNLLQELGRLDEAIAHHRQALATAPGYAMAHINLGSVLQALGRPEEAITHYKQAIAIDPNLAMAHYNLGIAVDEVRKPEEAVEHYRCALSIKPDYAEAHNNLGNVLDQLGQQQEAIDHYSRALTINPKYAEAHRNLARIDSNQGRASEIEELLTSESLPESDAIHCYFALGKIYSSAKNFDKAFENYSKGNRLKRKTVDYDSSDWAKYIDELLEIYTAEYFSNFAPAGSDSELPVFVVGMPRSGTSLVEQIISSHPEIYGAGELRSFGHFEQALAEKFRGPGSYPQYMRQCDQATILGYAERYLEKLRGFSHDAKRITDKMPANFAQIGLIKTLFPKARIIHCRRHKLDTCLSNYFNYFAKGNQYSFDLNELGQYYRDYERLMSHWHKIFQSEFLDIQYEELVTDQEKSSRRLVDYLGLEWDDHCLEFHENRRAVHNLSSTAVRQPVYTSSIDQWKHYEQHLQSLIEILGT